MLHAWLWLIGAIIFEVLGTTAMKHSEGFTKMMPSVAMGVFYLLSLAALTYALKKFDVSIAYAIWSGMGTALITLIGIWYFKESVSLMKLASIGFIIIGVVGLHLSGEQS